MRRFNGWAIALLLATSAVEGQSAPHGTMERTPRNPAAAAALAREIEGLRRNGDVAVIPAPDSFADGGLTIAAGAIRQGPVGVDHGNADISGRINGDVIAMHGDVVVHRGAEVTGDATSIGGRVLLDGGRVDGEMRSLSDATVNRTASSSARQSLTTWQSIKLVIGWFSMLFVIGIGVLVFAENNLDGVVMALERNVTRAFWYGVLGQVAVLPALLLLVVGLLLTILGALLIPFAIVAYVIALAGVVTLGFLAAARLAGASIATDPKTASARGSHLRALLAGLVLYMALWLVASLFAWSPLIGALVRGVAMAATWVPMTAGFGAAIVSRAGTQRFGATLPLRRSTPDDLSWQTPTPVTGVAASRRPKTVAAREV